MSGPIETGPRCGTCRWYMTPDPKRSWMNGVCHHRGRSKVERRIGPAPASPFDGYDCPCYSQGMPMQFKRNLQDKRTRPCKAVRSLHRIRLSIKEILQRINSGRLQ